MQVARAHCRQRDMDGPQPGPGFEVLFWTFEVYSIIGTVPALGSMVPLYFHSRLSARMDPVLHHTTPPPRLQYPCTKPAGCKLTNFLDRPSHFFARFAWYSRSSIDCVVVFHVGSSVGNTGWYLGALYLFFPSLVRV